MRADGTPLVSGFSLSLWPDLQSEVIQHAIGSNPEESIVYAGSNKRADVLAYGMTTMVSVHILHCPAFSDDCKDRRWYNDSRSFLAS